MVSESSIAVAKRVIQIEAQAVTALEDRINSSFEKAVTIILSRTGRVVITGMGKSGIIAKKIAATLTSTGTAALFLHPADALHGDVGLVLANDVVICISKSGNTDELTRLIPIIKRLQVPIIAMTGNLRSALAEKSDVVLDVGVAIEACPYDLAPTASTTATLVMGDALAMALLAKRNFSAAEFGRLHPGGTIGKRLLLRIEEVMFTGEKIPKVRLNSSLKETILEIGSKRFGSTCVVTETGKLAGIITDGDLRRLLTTDHNLWSLTAQDIMSRNPKTIPEGELALVAFQLMETHNILQVIVVNDAAEPIGMVHLHDLLEAGLQ
ncbi:KpsF/GutQ family sugar-phosphate isomerase [candidate division KSB1 bacterium]|nr:KpsF/GutQ family sugar-phosphate isomerase [candidate division KSB1 bacterium]